MTPRPAPRVRIVRASAPADDRAAFADDVRRGLTGARKSLPCRWFYDAEGSRLFDEICTLDEYDILRVETEVLTAHAAEIVRPRPASVVELGSGSAVKTRILLDALHGHPALYTPIDVSVSALEASAHELGAAYPSLSIVGVAGTYDDGLRRLRELAPAPRLVLWLGSNVGNFDRAGAAAFLGTVRRALGAHDRVLMGVELRKDAARLHAAYDDARGVTAAFNKNLLARINRELGGSFDLDDFAHRAVVLDGPGRVEMHLVARRAHTVRVAELDLEVSFAEGESIHTEDSTKYSREEIAALARAAGFAVRALWTDAAGGFADVILGAAK